MPADHPFCPSITWLLDEGIADGYDDGRFRPSASVTRQSLAAFLARHADAELPDCEVAPFPDVTSHHPFCAEITWSASDGITEGYGDGTFRPSLAISRQAAAAFLHRASTAG